MKFVIVICVVCVCCIIMGMPVLAHEADTAWVRKINGPGNDVDIASALACDANGNIYVTGNSYTPGQGWDIMTVKFLPDGDTAWVRTYNGADDSTDEAVAIAIDGSNNAYITGSCYNGHGSFDFITIKYLPNGDTGWVRIWYEGSGSNTEKAYDIAISDNQYIYVTGESYFGITNYDYSLVKYSLLGNEEWGISYNAGAGLDADRAPCITVTRSDTIYITGRTQEIGNNIMTMKYNEAGGGPYWSDRLDFGYEDEPRAITTDHSDNIIIAGMSEPDGISANIIVVKYLPTGDTAWARFYNGPGNMSDQGLDVVVDAENDIYVTGYCWDNQDANDYVLVKFDTDGNELWAKQFDGTAANNYDAAYAIALDSLGYIYITGDSYGDGTKDDCVTIKYHPDGDSLWVMSYDGGADSFDFANDITVYGSDTVYVAGASYNATSDYDYLVIKYRQGWTGVTFTDIAVSAGVDLPANNGQVSFADFNNDNLLDIYNDGTLLQNNGNSTFTDVTGSSNIVAAGYIGCTWGDLNNDGYIDLAVASYASSGAVILYQNNGGGTFTDITISSGINAPGFILCLVDFDNDGWLDIFSSYGVAHQSNGTIKLYKNNGDDTFTDVTTVANLNHSIDVSAAHFYDHDNDGDQDLVISAVHNTSHFFENNGDGTFTDRTADFGISLQDTQGISSGDYNRDGWLDHFVAVYSVTYSRLYRNDSGLGFTDVTSAANAAGPTGSIYRASSMCDYNNDGYLDIFQTKVNQSETNILFLQNGIDATFFRAEDSAGIGDVGNRGASHAYGDFDNDGDLDLLVEGEPGYANRLFSNNTLPDGLSTHWISFRLTGIYSNRSAIGTRLELYTGGSILLREISSGGGRSNTSLWPHFGLGSETTVDSVVIRWPSGMIQTILSPAINQYHSVTESGIGVTTLSDGGEGSLRWALDSANTHIGPDTIIFAISGTFAPGSALPSLTDDETHIWGHTAPLGSHSFVIDTVAAIGVAGLTVSSNNNEIAGLTFTRWDTCMVVAGDYNVILNCYLGITSDGTTRNAEGIGIFVSGDHNLIGGTGADDGNVIAAGGGRPAIQIGSAGAAANDNAVFGNLIGLAANGIAPLINPQMTEVGIRIIDSYRTLIGTDAGTYPPDPATGNFICGSHIGIYLSGGGDHVIRANYVGLDTSGTAAIGNRTGIEIAGSTGNYVGDTIYFPTLSNYICGSTTQGIWLGGVDADNNTIYGNFIGLDVNGDSRGNGLEGIEITSSASQNEISQNRIAYNGGVGIAVEDNVQAIENRFSRNIIYRNGDISIDLGNDGITDNDAGDIDDGANTLLNFPVIDSIYMNPDSTFAVFGRAGVDNTVEFFVAHPGSDSTRPADTVGNHGPAYSYIGMEIADGTGDFTFQVPSTVPQFSIVTATATDPDGSTSELSSNYTLVPGPLLVVAFSPVNIIVEDPDGERFGKDSLGQLINELTYPDSAYYSDDPHDTLLIYRPQLGTYIINFVSEAGAPTGSLYSSIIRTDGSQELVLIVDGVIPSTGQMDSYTYEVEEDYIYENGDANDDNSINVGDAVFIISYVFSGGAPPVPESSGDANCDGSVNVGDAVYLINHIFKGGPPPCYFEH